MYTDQQDACSAGKSIVISLSLSADSEFKAQLGFKFGLSGVQRLNAPGGFVLEILDSLARHSGTWCPFGSALMNMKRAILM